ncbi:MAG: hypothetical protein AAF512_12655 [Pseudomonadota bacterium]
MQLNCKSCNAQIPAEDVNIDQMVAKCCVCDAVFSFADQFPDAPPRRPPKTKVGQPKRISIDYASGGLVIARKWFRPLFIFLTFFAIFWDGFMVVWYYIAITEQEWVMGAFGTLHALVGIGLTYYVIAGYLNTTFIAVNVRELKITHRPLPFPGGKKLRSADIRQLFCKEKINRNKNGTYRTYELHALTAQGKRMKLLDGLPEPEEALFLEQEVQRFLKIKDAPVRGEYQAY